MEEPIVKQISVGPMLNLAYLLGDPDAHVCAAIDPGWEAGIILEEASKSGLEITHILLTHTHFDHTGALAELQSETGATVYVNALEAGEVEGKMPLEKTGDGSRIRLGSIDIECLHTPGHTPGSQCFMACGCLFTGDTLFVEGCGRVDLPGSSPRDMSRSLARLRGLDPKLIVFPGHDYGGHTAILGELIRRNEYLSEAGGDRPI